ncbi:MAG: hypothetical protein HY897_05510 [Deltaproteobacteria bacterium]|nr:hypothetical protein [Deltaproteobacteria bacterium]
MNFREATAIVLAAVWVFSAAACSCDEEQNEEDILAALADRLTDALGFEGATTVEGAPPAAHEDDPNYPRVTEFVAPVTLSGGQKFTVSLMSDFARPAEAGGAIVHVEGAGKHLKVKSTLDPEALVMRLLGTLKDDAELVGKSFSINLAIFDGSGAVGNYKTWGLEIAKPEETAPTTEELQEAMEVSGGVRVQGNIPKGTSDTAAPQVIEISVPNRVGVGKEFTVTVSYQNGSDDLRTLLMQVDNSTSYFELRASAPPQTKGDVTFTITFNENKLGAKKGGLAAARRPLAATGAYPAALEDVKISIKVALVDAAGKSGVPKKKELSFTTESGACTGKGCDTTAMDGGVDVGQPDVGVRDAGEDGGVVADAGEDGGVPTDAGGDTGDDGGQVCGEICSPVQIPFSADAIPQATVAIDPGRQTCNLITGYAQPDALVIDQMEPGYFAGSFGPGWIDLVVSDGMLYENYWENIPGNTELYVSMTHAGTGVVVGLTMIVTEQYVSVPGLCFGPGGGLDGGVVTDGGGDTDGGVLPDGGRKFEFAGKTIDGIAVVNDGGWVVGAATVLDGGYSLVGWNVRNNQTWEEPQFSQVFDVYPNPAGDGIVHLTKGGPSTTCIDATGQGSCMTEGLMTVYADFGGGSPADLLLVGSSNMIEIRRAFGNLSQWQGTTARITGTPGMQWRLVAFAPNASTMGGIAVADPNTTMLEMYCNELMIQIPENVWNTTFPVFRLAAAGSFAFAATNEGQYGGSAKNSALLIVDSNNPMAGPQTINAPGGDFWGVAAVPSGMTVRFAAGTKNDGVLLGAVDRSTGEFCSDWVTSPGGAVSDVAFTWDGNDLIFASGDTIEARDLKSEVVVCTPPGGMLLRR